MSGKRCYFAGAVLTLALAVLGAGCIEDVGVALIVTPDTLNFGIDTNRLTLSVSKNVTTAGSGPLVARNFFISIVETNITRSKIYTLIGTIEKIDSKDIKELKKSTIN